MGWGHQAGPGPLHHSLNSPGPALEFPLALHCPVSVLEGLSWNNPATSCIPLLCGLGGPASRILRSFKTTPRTLYHILGEALKIGAVSARHSAKEKHFQET